MYQRLKSRIDNFRAAVAAIGVWDATLSAVARVMSRTTSGRVRIVKYEFVSQPVEVPEPSSRPRPGRFRVDWAGPESTLFTQIERPAAVIAQRFAQGARCLAATDGERNLAGFLWFVIGPYDEDEVRARFVPVPQGAAAWDFDVAILPQYRMGRLFAQLWGRAMEEMSALGIDHTLSRISAFNAASRTAHRRLGAAVRGHAMFVCVDRIQLMISSIAPRFHLSWHEEQRPTLIIRS